MINKKYFVLGTLTTIVLIISLDLNAGSFNSFKLQVDNYRKAWKLFYPNMFVQKKEKIGKAIDIIKMLPLKKDEHAYNTFSYIQGRFMYLNQNKKGADKYLINSMSIATLPECLLVYLEGIKPYNRSRGKQCRKWIGNILPVSGYLGRAIIGGNTRALPNPPRPRIPNFIRKDGFKIAELFKKAGFYELAWRCYVEAIYKHASPSFTKKGLEESWFSEEVAIYWLEAAQCAFWAGRKELAWNYLCKAAVFGSDQTYGQAMMLAVQWNKNEDIKKPEITEDVKKKALKEIVNLYCKLNAHPRALELINKYPKLFNSPEKLRKEVETKWLRKVRIFCRFTDQVTIYGVEVHPQGNPLDIRIPWAFPKKELEKVKQQLIEKLKK